MACVDDSQACVAERSTALQHIMADKQRVWIRQPAPVEAYASGVRLFALKQKKRDLTCEELGIGRREAEAARNAARAAGQGPVSGAGLARRDADAQEVGRELDNEMKRRCKA